MLTDGELLRARVKSGDYSALESMRNLCLKLTPKEEKVLRLLFGIGCERKYSGREIATEFDISTQRVYSIRRQAFARLESFDVDRAVVEAFASMEEQLRRRRAVLRSPFDEPLVALRSGVERLIDEAELSKERLMLLSPREFEEFIAEIWYRFGYAVELTARTRDGGKDVVAIKKTEAHVRYIIECKRYDHEHKVGVSLVRALYGVKMHDRATKAFLATTSTFTRGATQFFEHHKWELEARDFEGILNWAKQAARFSQQTQTGLWMPGAENV
jgi:restriction endonuclease Mrr